MSITIPVDLLFFLVPYTLMILWAQFFDGTRSGSFFSSSERDSFYTVAIPAATIIALITYVVYLRFFL